jgi:ATP-binding cassette subfamily B multidrug efflux pump
MFARFEKTIDPFPEAEIPVPPGSFFPFVLSAVKGIHRYIICIGCLSALVGVFEALLFAFLGGIVDRLAVVAPDRFREQEGEKLLLLGLAVVGSTLLVGLQSLIRWQAVGGNLPARLRWHFHRLMLRQSMSFFQDEFAGRIATKVMQTSQALRDIYLTVVDIMVFAVVYFVTMSSTIGWFDVRLLWPFALWLSAYLALLRGIVPKLAASSRQVADSRSLVVGRITDAYTNIATVKLFSHAGREASYAQKAMREFLDASRLLLRRISLFEMVNHLLSMLLIVSSCGMVLRLWTQGRTGVGALAAVGAMSLRLNGMSHWIMWESTQLFEHAGAVHDGMKMLSRTRQVTDRPDAGILRITRGGIRFENVVFSYGGQRPRPVIDNFSLDIRPGEKIGLVGRSGAGKSTLVSLLLRFHDVETGRILIDGQDIATVTQESLRAGIGMVMQDTSLLHRSVRDNILYGRPDASEEAMRAAAARAEAGEFILNLADAAGRGGYDAHVGERGVKLSGGQRQRIAIAGVMLKDAPILLLDEATSALDSEVENAIQENLYRLMEGKTVVAIAHRLATIAAMDRLVVVDDGRIAEEGDHRTLLARDGVYARLWKHQSGGFLGVDGERENR